MRTYEVTVKVPAYYGWEGAGTMLSYKVDAGNRGLAAGRAVRLFNKEKKSLDAVGRTMFLTVVRVG
jgi:hypothetical protein